MAVVKKSSFLMSKSFMKILKKKINFLQRKKSNQLFMMLQIQDIVENHTERRRAERLIDPSRFNKKLTIAEKAIRRPADAALFENDDTYDDEELDFSTFKSNRGYCNQPLSFR